MVISLPEIDISNLYQTDLICNIKCFMMIKFYDLGEVYWRDLYRLHYFKVIQLNLKNDFR